MQAELQRLRTDHAPALLAFVVRADQPAGPVRAKPWVS
jgi:hypothetical protein